MTSSYLLALAATGPCGATSFGNTAIAEFAGLFDTALFSCLDLFCFFPLLNDIVSRSPLLRFPVEGFKIITIMLCEP